MKKIIFTLILFLTISMASVFANNNIDNNDNTYIQPKVEAFSKIYINIPSNIYFIESDTYDIQIYADKELKKYIQYTVEGDTMSIKIMPHFLSEELMNNKNDIKIYIKAPNINMKISTPITLLVSDTKKLSNIRNYEND